MQQHVRRMRQPKVTTRVTSLGPVKRADASRQITEDKAFTTIAGETPSHPALQPCFSGDVR